jgi:hypothetical protein
MNRQIKDFLIKNYYNFRINTVQSPYKIRLRNDDYKFIFICSHMRSGSSLLTHILVSNPEIIGYGETHINYNSESDLKKLVYRVYGKIRNYGMNEKYVLDKVLHNNKFINYDFLTSDNIYTIFLLREPKRTLNSILDLKPHWNQEQAFTYYCDRLSKLADYAKLINNKNRSLLLNYQQIIDDSETVFQSLKSFLNTENVFSEQYEIMRTTGMKGVGDSSDNIKTGKIIRTSRELEERISPDFLERAIASFEENYAILAKYCQIINR